METIPKSISVKISDKMTINVLYFFSDANLSPNAEEIELFLRFDDFRNASLGYQFLVSRSLIEDDENTKTKVENEIKEYFKES